MSKEFTKIIYRPHTKAYVVNNLCYPHPDDETVPKVVREAFQERYYKIDAYAKENPELVTIENPPEPYVPTLKEVKKTKLAEINSKCDQILKYAVATYPETEQQTFYKQDAESAAYLANPETADTPFLTTLAAARGIDLETMVTKVRAKTDAFAQLSAFICGQRQAMEDSLDKCSSKEEVEALPVEFTLPEGYKND